MSPRSLHLLQQIHRDTIRTHVRGRRVLRDLYGIDDRATLRDYTPALNWVRMGRWA